MQIEFHRGGTLDDLQEVTELHAAVASVDFGDDRASLDVQCSKEVGRAVSQVIMCMALRPARLHGNRRCGVAVRLDGGLLVHAQHQSTLGRMQIEVHDVSHLVDEIWVSGELGAFGAMRRQGEDTPDARDGGLAQPRMGSERAG